MGKLILTSFVTLDGVYQAPGGPDEDRRNGFEHGGWSVPYGDDDFGDFVIEVFSRVDAFLLGRFTYDIFSSYWPRITDPGDPIAGKLNSLPKYVVSHTLKSAEWTGTTVLSGDPGEEVAALKERTDGEIQIHGSGALAQTLLSLDLIDTVHLLTFPVVLGTGFRLFTRDALPTAFRHGAGRITGRGVSIQTYEREGRPTYGSHDLPEDAAKG